MRESWAEYKRLPLHAEMTEEEKDRILNGRWVDGRIEEASWNAGSGSLSSRDIQSVTMDE